MAEKPFPSIVIYAMKKIARAIQIPKRSPRAVSADTLAFSLKGPIRRATQTLAIIAERVALIEKKIPIAAPANAAWDMVNPSKRSGSG
jgi:hypothetical protein